MERAIAGNKHVVIVCTPRYKIRSENREGGVGYEGDIMTAELLRDRNRRKFIPVLRRGSWRDAAPGWLAGSYFIDLTDGPRYEAQYEDLLNTLLGSRPVPPPVGPPRSGSAKSPAASPPAAASEPPRIVGVIADEVGVPRNDGTRGSALYSVPFRLSRRVSDAWADVFGQVWNSPPRRTNMHRPGIASVTGDRVVLNSTTIDEVQKYHRDTLVLCVQETNRIIADREAAVARAQLEQRRVREEHEARVRDISRKIRFDE